MKKALVTSLLWVWKCMRKDNFRKQHFTVGLIEYVARGDLSIMEGAIYVERLTPQRVTQPSPLLVIHGHGE
jgi:hypothetical protein